MFGVWAKSAWPSAARRKSTKTAPFPKDLHPTRWSRLELGAPPCAMRLTVTGQKTRELQILPSGQKNFKQTRRDFVKSIRILMRGRLFLVHLRFRTCRTKPGGFTKRGAMIGSDHDDGQRQIQGFTESSRDAPRSYQVHSQSRKLASAKSGHVGTKSRHFTLNEFYFAAGRLMDLRGRIGNSRNVGCI